MGEKPDELIHADFIYMGSAEGSSLKYVLIIKDNISSYSQLCSSKHADSDAVTTAEQIWIACFGNMDWLVANQGSHFKSLLMSSLSTHMHIKQHINTAYCP